MSLYLYNTQNYNCKHVYTNSCKAIYIYIFYKIKSDLTNLNSFQECYDIKELKFLSLVVNIQI